MGNRYLIIDIGEKSGRHILGSIRDEKLEMEMVHQFEVKYVEKDGKECPDLEHIVAEIKTGLKKCRDIGKLPVFVGIAAWENDFVLLGKEDRIICGPDSGTDAISRLKTVRALLPDDPEQTCHLLMIPDYLNFCLTGKKFCEFSNAISTRLIDWETRDWDETLIDIYQFPRHIFTTVSYPGAILGCLTREVTEEVGYDCIIALPASRKVAMSILKLPEDQPELDEELRICAGNLMVLMISSHEIKDLAAARECLRKTYQKSALPDEKD